MIRKELRAMVRTFENVLNRDEVTGDDIEKNEKVCDTLEMKEDSFCEEELETVLKKLKNNKVSGTDSEVNDMC